ncbi:ABC transporter permease [Acidobacteria bacterium AH-259-D05]|nr:ABC transporter permease [Acidobacteria bacterium AH-259-D05]
MASYLLRRLAMLPLVALGVTLLLFALLQLLSPEMRASLYIKDPRQLAALESIIQTYHLREPFPVQYWTWLKQIAGGDLGYSETAKMPVAEAVKAFFPATFELALTAFIPILVIGIWLGTQAALHQDRPLDHFSRFMAITGYSLPSFVLGLLLLMIFYGKFNLFPPGRFSLEADLLIHSQGFTQFTGFLLLDSLLNGKPWIFWDLLKHLILPAFTLCYNNVALLIRITRSSMLEEINKDYVRTARAKGLEESVVVNRHARKNALIPVITSSSLLLIGLLGGVVITETIFNYPGIGRWGVNAARQLDIAGMMGFALVSATLFVLGNLAADLLYVFVDPRIRLK